MPGTRARIQNRNKQRNTMLYDIVMEEMEEMEDIEAAFAFTEAEELIRNIREAMPFYEEYSDWEVFNRLRARLERLPFVYNFVMAGPMANKIRTSDIKVNLWSVKGNTYRQFYDYMQQHYGTMLEEREMKAGACLLENIHQHVKNGIGLCVIRNAESHTSISVIDNGTGFYDYKKQRRLKIRDAVKFGKAYGSRYKSLGQALAITCGLWSDLSVIETPCESSVIMPERFLKKAVKYGFRILVSMAIAITADLATLTVREDISAADPFIIALIFLIAMNRSGIKRVLFRKRSYNKYFPQVISRTKNRQKFGTTIHLYFCHTGNVRKWRRRMVKEIRNMMQT